MKNETSRNNRGGLFTYENGTVLLMALIFGCLFFDRLALNFLMPYVAKDLQLDNTQIGLLAGGLSLAWAFSSFFTTAWAETDWMTVNLLTRPFLQLWQMRCIKQRGSSFISSLFLRICPIHKLKS